MLDESITILRQLHAKYESDPYMASRLHNFISNQLSGVLESMDANHQQRVARTEELHIEFDAFVKTFMTTNKYFYVSSTERFFYYDGVHYRVYSEDGILHHILTTITNDRNLLSWKYKTKVSIMKRIRENPLLTSVPESGTIQTVIMSLYPSFFSSKTAAKYFLTILGDNILKKKTNLVHLVPPYAKSFIRELNNYCQINIGTSMMQSFKLKYHEHDYINCRLLHINETVKYEATWKHMIEDIGIDMMCVATHYSTRFDNSDVFIERAQDSDVRNHTRYLRTRTPSDLVNEFVGDYITETAGGSITWKNLQYLWKHHLSAKQLPTVIFQAPLKSLLINRFQSNYCESTDSFNGIFSRCLPEIQKFLRFWDDNMVEDGDESGLELEEIRYMSGLISFSDEQILGIIQYFYPNVIVENDKYVQEMRCIMWDKTKSLRLAFDAIHIEWPDKTVDLSVYDAYLFYCKRSKTANAQLIVNKSYFENYVAKYMGEALSEPGIISRIWFS